MRSRKTLVSLASAAALTLAISGATFAAGPPTITGEVQCERASGGYVDDMGTFTGTRKELAGMKRFWVSAGYCKKGTVEVLGLTRV